MSYQPIFNPQNCSQVDAPLKTPFGGSGGADHRLKALQLVYVFARLFLQIIVLFLIRTLIFNFMSILAKPSCEKKLIVGSRVLPIKVTYWLWSGNLHQVNQCRFEFSQLKVKEKARDFRRFKLLQLNRRQLNSLVNHKHTLHTRNH